MHARSRLADVADHFSGRALVLSSVGAVAWATGGVSVPIDRVAQSDPVWVVVKDGRITLIVSSVEVARLSDGGELASLGFDVVAAPWYEEGAHRRLATSLAGEDCASDVEGLGVDASFELTRARLGLCGAEIDVMRGLGRVATEAIESAVGQWRPGESSDREIAARVTSDLERHGADAVCLIVGGDERLARYRHPMMCGDVPAHALMAVVVARFSGLHVALTRLAATDPEESRGLMEKCQIVEDHVREALRVGATWGEVYEALGAGYRAVGQPDAWREHFQGGPIGYGQREFELSPGSADSRWWREPVATGCAVSFNPSLAGGAKIEDTYLVGEGLEPLTDSGRWPRITGSESGAAVIAAREKKAS